MDEKIKELFIKNAMQPKKLSLLIDKYLTPHHFEKINNAEVSTPHNLRNEMLDKIPGIFWKSKKKIFEPCCGKGGFLLDIIDRFMDGMKVKIPDRKERYKIIVEECIYFSDINSINIYICKLLLNPKDKYKLNYNRGDTLELSIKDKWNIDGFDAVIGNPPYNSSGHIGSGNTIWQNFTKEALQYWLNDSGFLLFVHPPGWRKPCYEKSQLKGLFKLMAHENLMIYLSMHDIKDGIDTFRCGTKYDWYLIKKTERTQQLKSEMKMETV